MDKNKYWTKERLSNISTIETAIDDYNYGFYTSFDGDNKIIINGNACIICSSYFEKTREDGRRLAGKLCNNCRNKIKYAKTHNEYYGI